MTWTRLALFFIADFVFGIVLMAGLTFFFARTATGQAYLRDFLVSEAQHLALSTPATVPPLVSSSSSTTTPAGATILPIPASYATTDYFLAINNVIADLVLMNNANVALGPVLEKLNEKTLSCSYDGFYDLMGQARALANKNQALAAQFLMHITALKAANNQTMDAVTKSDTQVVVAAGESLGAALQQYSTAVQAILYGDTPTSVQLTQFQAQVTSVSASSQNFADALKPLLDHIGAEIQRLQSVSAGNR